MDPIYHFYMHCLNRNVCPSAEIAAPNLCYMDTMYNRWAVQNAVQLRQRILDRQGAGLLLGANDDGSTFAATATRRRLESSWRRG